MTHFTIQLTITDDRFINPSDLGSNTTRRTIYKGKADNDEIALSEAEKICGPLTPGGADVIGRKYRTWVRQHVVHHEAKFYSSMVVTFQSELQARKENKNNLPKNIVERCDYAAQHLDTLDLSKAQVDTTMALNVPVTHIRMDYPFETVKEGVFNVYEIAEAKDWGDLLLKTIKVFQREYNAGKCVAPHTLEDFIIERIDIHPNNLATIYIGS